MKSTEVLTKFRVLPRRDIYQLGCRAKLLNVHAQQQRAFNLIWALADRGKLVKNEHIAVVGAGIAGTTAAIAATACGATVHLYDSKTTVMHLQRGNDTRFLHPNIANWPDKSFGYPLTDLPFFNWRADSAGNVVKQLSRQWEASYEIFAPQLSTEFLGTAVTEVGVDPSGEVFLATTEGRKNYKTVILAIGYGLEKSMPSYWRNDDLAQPVIGESKRKTYYVSGAGDGSLTEILRLTIKNFHHQEFIQSVMHDKWLINQAKELSRSGRWKDFILTERHRKQPDFLRLMRDDTDIYFGATSSFYSSRKAQILHRICVALLMKYHPNLVRYREGTLQIPKSRNIKRVAITSGDTHKITKHIPVDAVVDRRGADQVLDKLFPHEPGLLLEIDKKWAGPDRTARPLYGTEFLADELKTCHLESRYQIGFLLRSPGDKEKITTAILSNLGLRLPRSLQRWLTQTRISKSAPVNFALDKQFYLSLENAIITRRMGDDPQNYSEDDAYTAGSWRIFADSEIFKNKTRIKPHKTSCLWLHTESRHIVEQLLLRDQLPYQVYRVFLDEAFEKYLHLNFPSKRPDYFVNFDTTHFLISRDDLQIPHKYFEVHTTGNMLTAHLLLRAPTMLEILLNQWPTTKVHGMGWAIGCNRKDLRNKQDQNLLLEWNPL